MNKGERPRLSRYRCGVLLRLGGGRCGVAGVYTRKRNTRSVDVVVQEAPRDRSFAFRSLRLTFDLLIPISLPMAE